MSVKPMPPGGLSGSTNGVGPTMAGGQPFKVGRFMQIDEAKDRVAALDFMLKRGTGEDASDAMKSAFASATLATKQDHDRTLLLQRNLQLAQEAVDAQMKLNRENMDFVAKQLPEQLEAAANDFAFWDNELMKDHFNLHSALDAEKLDEKKGLLNVMLKTPGTLGSREFAPLRRCFAPIIRQRDSISKSFTLLLNDLEEVQKKSVPLEERMMDSMFDVPLEIPLRHIAEYIQRVLLTAPTAHELETNFFKDVYPQFKQSKKRYAALLHETNPKSVLQELELELQLRKDLQPACIQVIVDAMAAEKQLEATLIPSHKKVEEEYVRDVSVIRKACKGITASAMACVQQVVDVRSAGVSVMKNEEDRHKAGMKEVEFKLKSSHDKQERLQRQIRQLHKELAKEQTHHEHHMHEATERLQSWAQLKAANKQFLAACDYREDLLSTASERCQFLADLVDQSQLLGEQAIRACSFHCSRTLSEESFRKLRASKHAVDNVTDWHRCVGDLDCSKQYRLQSVEAKMKDSWQMRYLLDHEKKKLQAGVMAIANERAQQDTAWSEVAVYLAEFKIPLPSLSRHDQDDSVIAMRTHFVQIEIDQSPERLRDPSGRGASNAALGIVSPTGSTAGHGPVFRTPEEVVLPPVPPPRRRESGNEDGHQGDATPLELPKAPPRGALKAQ